MHSNYKPVRVDAVVISTQHAETVGNDELRAGRSEECVIQEAVIPANLLDEDTKYHASTRRGAVLSSGDRWAIPA